MGMRTTLALAALLLTSTIAATVTGSLRAQNNLPLARPGSFDETIQSTSGELFRSGQQIFRFDTFGDERFWSDTLKLHTAIAGAALGGARQESAGRSSRTDLAR